MNDDLWREVASLEEASRREVRELLRRSYGINPYERRRMIEGDWLIDREIAALRHMPQRPYEDMSDALVYFFSDFPLPMSRSKTVPVLPPPTPGTTQILPLDVKPEHPMLELGPENNDLQPEAPPLPWFEFDEVGCPLLDE